LKRIAAPQHPHINDIAGRLRACFAQRPDAGIPAWPALKKGIKGLALGGESNVVRAKVWLNAFIEARIRINDHAHCRSLPINLPGARSVDTFPVYRHPIRDPLQDVPLIAIQFARGWKWEVQQEISVLADNVDKQVYDFL
jgi:hypothetical protein